MFEFLQNLEPMIQVLSEVLLGLVITATSISRVVAKGKHMSKVDGFASKLLKVIQYLPTFGINPKTKELEEAYKEVKNVPS